MIVGYARVSTGEQKIDLQIQALERMGCDQVFSDHGQSGSDFERAGLEAALDAVVPGDMLVVWRLDRLGRSLVGLVGLLEQLGKRHVHFRSLSENIDTASSGGKLMFHMMAALAEFERSLISERTRAGMAAAKVRGARLGRPSALTMDQIVGAQHAIERLHRCPSEVAKELNVCRRTLSRHLGKLTVNSLAEL
ncbi:MULTISPECIES: recombinase family protein [Rhizobium/Agrobacterium group]|jgi:DNA invertase Pin-like site-specific DNA recombinase|uniref:Recombinase family protein n=2 Tax=Rhizobium/Agrobacterium group TaxID=227290 RepID=A0AA92BZ04_RHIRH|nr:MULTISPECIES: recombinase family protein [Rhizobium/Agrobacterium group]MDP9563504.1 DNA invertase Pin-like site-specific DNA recombinase [Rhizobium nepotum]MDP9573809.1 DNA invertase Pin-like site-specific DNA recombinase [Agrobacterium larrymoorei]PVE62596.1 recombinase family protein [Agrobacterium tumefaciens]PVE70734.1 recombinase family protein [Sphingomonas sp. TPD3009]PVE50143.1 recombinase family protein [Rhizobium rhizogenes]